MNSRTRIEPEPEVDTIATLVIGATIEVHRTLGPGFLESVYEDALAVELRQNALPFSRQHPVAVCYRGVAVGHQRLDLLVAEKLIVEIKAVEQLLPIHTAQVISYLKATGLHLGLLINFNVTRLQSGIKRLVRS